MMEFMPIESWDYTKDATSRMLQELRIISSILYNVNKRKTQKAIKPEEHFEPSYVKEYRKDYEEWKAEQKVKADEIEQMGQFWEKRTGVKMAKKKDE